MARVFVGRGFLVQNDADADKSVENMILADNSGGAVMSIEIEKVK